MSNYLGSIDARWRSRRCSLFSLILLWALAQPAGATEPPAPPDAAPAGDAVSLDAPPADSAAGDEGQLPLPPSPALPAPPEAQVPIEAEATSWDGITIPLLPDTQNATIPAGAHFRLFSERALVDLRIKLVDEDGKLVPTRDRATVGAGTNYEIRPVEALVTGTRYRLVVDGQFQPYAKDVEGTSYSSRSFEFITEGEKPPPPPKVRTRRRR